MLVAMRGGQPDCVPAAPDMSNMIPCRLTGKLHTTEVMLNGTPDANILAIIDIARTHGRC